MDFLTLYEFSSAKTLVQNREIGPPPKCVAMNTEEEENELQTKKQVGYLLMPNYTLGVQFSCPNTSA